MFQNFCNILRQNKNLLMMFTVGIYIFALLGVLSDLSVLFIIIWGIFCIFCICKEIFPIKFIIIWTLIFFIGNVNTSFRLRGTDELLSIAPKNAVITGQIISIPQTTNSDKTRFFFHVKNIEYDGITRNFKKEKVLVTINTEDKFNIYDTYKIRGRLSMPIKAGNPSQFDYGNYLRNYSTYAVFYGRNPYEMKDLDIPCYEKLPSKLTKTEQILQEINNYREKIISVHSHYLQSPYLEILGGIVFGDDAVSPPENIKQSFVNSGLLHILAASGMNVAFIYSFFFFILNLFKVNFRVNVSICILAVITYVLMTGLGASVLRAALMLLFVLIGKLIDRDAHSISLLSFVAFLMLLYNPMYINDVGFQLSFVVTFGLLVMTPYLIKSKNKIINWIIGSLTIPIIAQLWVIPIQIFYFNNISVYSVFANIMSVPFLSIISFGGFISSLLSLIQPISEFVCKCFDFVLGPLIQLVVSISDFWGNLPNSSLQTSHPSVIQIFLYYLVLMHIVWIWDKDIREKYWKVLRYTLTSLLIILSFSFIQIPNHNLEITAFDVGNADAFLIKTPNNKYIVIDTAKSGYNGGKSQAEMIIIKYLKDNGIKKLNSIIVTHFDNDHSGGAVDLLNSLKVDEIYVNSLNHDSKSANEIYNAAKLNGAKLIEAQNKQTIFDENGLKMTNLISKDTAGIGDNESSILTVLTYKDFSMLFTGDAGIETFNKLKANIPNNITVLKVGHHGASGVIDKNMAEYLNPKYSLVSTGENKFGHPSIYTLETLKKSQILRTDINNSIRFVVDNNKSKVLTYDSKYRKFRK